MTEDDFLGTTRASYDAVAGDYAERTRGELAARPLDRAMLAGFAELVRAAGAGPVADVGCGTGRVTAHLNGLGLAVFGIDLSPGMIAAARQAHPGLRFEVGSMLALDLPDGVLGGVLAWCSTIHIPQMRLPEVFAEFQRVLAPGGYVQLAFQAGDETLHLTEAGGMRSRSTSTGGSRIRSPGCWARPGSSSGPGCCASLTTAASFLKGPRRPSCWPVSRAEWRRADDVVLGGILPDDQGGGAVLWPEHRDGQPAGTRAPRR